MNKLKIAKKHFQKYGLSENVLGVIVSLLPNEEEATEETIVEQLQAYEPLAKSFQSEVERRVSLVKKEEKKEDVVEDSVHEKSSTQSDELLNAIKNIAGRLDMIEKGQISSGLSKKAVDKLKSIKMTDKEIEAVMLGRNFDTEEAVEEFVTKQGEIYEEILSTRHMDNAGSGFAVMSGQGSYDKKAIEQDIADFNKVY